jgi:DNA-binding HxlR family transcriptional regulator
MARRTYAQFCPVAAALDLLGERWTLLVVRELMLGPRRYTDLQAALPGLGTSLLAERLRAMVDAGLIARTRIVGAPAYELTARGAAAAPVVRELAVFGAGLLGEPDAGEAFRPEALALYLAATMPPGRLHGVRECYQLDVDDAVLHIRVAHGSAVARLGPPPDPADLVVRTDRDGFVALGLRRTGLRDLVRSGRATATGPRDVRARAERLFSPSS